MIKMGVTGGIGSGKTTFCKVWEEKGVPVYYADEAAKVLMVQDADLVQSLKKTFGTETYRADGSLNKDHLIYEAFSRGRVDDLNRLVHPAVGRDFLRYCEEAESDGHHMVLKEAALLLNNGRPDELDLIILLLAKQEKRLEWVSNRDDVTRSDVKARLDKQPVFEELTDLADYVIPNDGSVNDLKSRASELYEKVTSKMNEL